MTTREFINQIEKDFGKSRKGEDATASIVAVALARTSVAVSRNLSAALEPFGINASGFDVLITLQRAGTAEGLPVNRLASLMAVTPASVTNRVDNLAEKVLVERIICPTDRRSWYVRLLPAGADLLRTVRPIHMAGEAEQLRGLPAADRRALLELLLKLADGLEGVAQVLKEELATAESAAPNAQGGGKKKKKKKKGKKDKAI